MGAAILPAHLVLIMVVFLVHNAGEKLTDNAVQRSAWKQIPSEIHCLI